MSLTHITVDEASELSFGSSFDADETECGMAFSFVRDDIVDTGRWEVFHEILFTCADEFYMFTYAEPATEYQENPLEDRFEGNPVPVHRMIAKEVTTVEYVRA